MTVVQSDFTLERTYPAPPARVFRAWSRLEDKQRWFGGAGDGAATHELDFRVGGHEALRTTMDDGTTVAFDVTYMDIVEDERIVYAYDMHMGGRRISASLAVIELEPVDDGTRLIVTEHGAFLDDLDKAEFREQGTTSLLDALGASLSGDPHHA